MLKSETPSIHECGFIWKWGLCRCNQDRIRLIGWVLIQYYWCPYERGRCHGKMKVVIEVRQL